MASLKAIVAMVIWTAVAVGIMNAVGFNEHFRSPIWTLGAGILLLVILMVNVWIFFVVAKDEPWKWMKQ